MKTMAMMVEWGAAFAALVITGGVWVAATIVNTLLRWARSADQTEAAEKAAKQRALDAANGAAR